MSMPGAHANQPLKAPRLRAASRAKPGKISYISDRVTAGTPSGVVKIRTSRNLNAADFVHKSAQSKIPAIAMKSPAARAGWFPFESSPEAGCFESALTGEIGSPPAGSPVAFLSSGVDGDAWFSGFMAP